MTWTLYAKLRQFHWQSGQPSAGTLALTEIAAETGLPEVVDVNITAEDLDKLRPSMWMKTVTLWMPNLT